MATKSTAEILTSSGDREGSYEWATPQDVFGAIAEEWGPFNLDPAATAENAKAPAFYTMDDDGLSQPWSGCVFVNPPYGHDLSKWVRKACEEHQRDAWRVVMLIPARTDTRWWHEIVMPFATKVLFVKGRIKFEQEGKDNSATFANVIVVFDRYAYNIGHCPKFSSFDPKFQMRMAA